MKILREALIALNDWVMDGLPDHDIFSEDFAICSNIENYFYLKCPEIKKRPDPLSLCYLFEADGLNSHFPFNENSSDWSDELFSDWTWKNEKRLAWLKKHGTRTISDCVPLALRTENPEIFVLANVYLRGEDVYCLPKLWWHHPRLGITEIEDFAVKQQARGLFSSLGVKLNYR